MGPAANYIRFFLRQPPGVMSFDSTVGGVGAMDIVVAKEACWVYLTHIIVPKKTCVRERAEDAQQGSYHLVDTHLRGHLPYSAIKIRQPQAAAHIVNSIQPALLFLAACPPTATTSAHPPPPLPLSINLSLPHNGTSSISFGLSKALFKVSRTASDCVYPSDNQPHLSTSSSFTCSR